MTRSRARWLPVLAVPLIIAACGGTVGSNDARRRTTQEGGASGIGKGIPGTGGTMSTPSMLPGECFCTGIGVTDICPCPPTPTDRVDSGPPEFVCPTYPGWPPPGEPFDGNPSQFDAATFGCYSREFAPADWRQTPGMPDCGGNGQCTYEPSALPCGACTTEGSACALDVWAACDCGKGRFLQTYTDVWVCKCANGNWDCGVVAPSGASCTSCAPVIIVDAGAK
jgi:hypothetical protein